MDDAQLVAAALAGERSAFAAIYDRYANRVYDFCASILRNRADASDVLQETFLVAFETVDKLADPERLGAWLYAIAHRAILDRTGADGTVGRALGADAASDLVWGTAAADERPSRAELAEFVWQASGGLDERERALLDLHLRQGLEGADLASAAGVAAGQIDSRVERLEVQVERSLGALLVARTGRRSCAGLFTVLDGWDGRLTPEFRQRITAHVDDCETCNSRRRIAPNPLALLAAAAPAAAPTYLRGVVLGKAELEALEREGVVRRPGRMVAGAGWVFNRDGFPDLAGGVRGATPTGVGPVFASTRETSVMAAAGAGAGAAGGAGGAGGSGAARDMGATTYLPAADPRSPAPDDRDRRGMLVGGIAGLIILFAAIVIVVSSRSKSPVSNVGVGVTTSAVTATTRPSNTTAFAPPSSALATTIPPSTLATIGHLIVGGSKAIDLGTSASTSSLVVGNDGAAPVDFTATATGAGLTVNPPAGTLSASGSQTLTVTLDRSASAPGAFTGAILINSQGGVATVTVNATIDPGPTITSEMQVPPTVYTSGCKTQTTPTSSVITATVTTTLPLTVVVLHWQSVANGPGTRTMTGTGSAYSATLGPFEKADAVDWWVTAIDNANATGNSSHQSLTVTCPA